MKATSEAVILIGKDRIDRHLRTAVYAGPRYETEPRLPVQ